MKKTLTSLLLLLAMTSLSIAQNCQTPTSAAVFQNGFNSIAIQQNDQLKLTKAVRFTGDKCLYASQVKTIALLFSADSVRLEYCEMAYAHTFDPANYFDVYDAFHSFSSALRLYDYVQHATTPVVVDAAPVQVSFPAYAYPDTNHYAGRKGCNGPAMTENAFKQAAQNVFIQPTDESKFVAVQSIANQNCLTFAQSMKLASLMKSDDYRLRTLTNTFYKVYDQEHYASGIVLFSTTQAQNDWTNFAKSYLTPPPPECKVTEAEFKTIMNDLQAKRFPDEKMNMVELLAKDRCFTVAQIRKIAAEFAFGEEKMKTYKLLYPKCKDQNNYYQVIDDLSFASEKDEMKRFIAAGGK